MLRTVEIECLSKVVIAGHLSYEISFIIGHQNRNRNLYIFIQENAFENVNNVLNISVANRSTISLCKVCQECKRDTLIFLVKLIPF